MTFLSPKNLTSQRLQRGFIGVGVAYAALAPPGFMVHCPFHAATGCLCPGCGLQRGLHALTRLDVAAALHDNAMLFLLPIFLLLAHITKPAGRLGSMRYPLLFLASSVTIGFTVIRNLPGSTLVPLA